jgi:hypothetical protein
MTHIAYRKGFKYQLALDYLVKTSLRPSKAINTKFLFLGIDGWLLIRAGYAWDGPSGPTFDTSSSMRGSLIHDALYQLLREGLLPPEARQAADRELYAACIQDRMWRGRADLWLREVNKFAGSAADPKNLKQVFIAPR